MTNKGKKYAPKLTLAPMEFEEAVQHLLGATTPRVRAGKITRCYKKGGKMLKVVKKNS